MSELQEINKKIQKNINHIKENEGKTIKRLLSNFFS